MITVKSQADVFRIPPGTRLTVTWPASGKTAGRTFHQARSADVVFVNDAGSKTYLTLRGATITAVPGGFDVSWPGDPGTTACQYRFTEET